MTGRSVITSKIGENKLGLTNKKYFSPRQALNATMEPKVSFRNKQIL